MSILRSWLLLFCLCVSAWGQQSMIEVETNLVIPGRIVDLVDGGMLLRTSSGASILLPDSLAMQLADRQNSPAVGAAVKVYVPIDSAEVSTVDAHLVTIRTRAGTVQLPVAMLPESLLTNTKISYPGESQAVTLREAIRRGGYFNPDHALPVWNVEFTAPAVVVAVQAGGRLAVATLIDGLPSLRSLQGGPALGATRWLSGTPITAWRSPETLRIDPWTEGLYVNRSEAITRLARELVESVDAPPRPILAPSHPALGRRQSRLLSGKRRSDGVLVHTLRSDYSPAATTGIGRRPAMLGRLPQRGYPLARSRPARPILPEVADSVLLPVYSEQPLPSAVEPAPLAAQVGAAGQVLAAYTDLSAGVVPTYYARSRPRDPRAPGY